MPGQVSNMKKEVPLPLPPGNHPPAFVLGGDQDVIVDIQALEESAEVYGVKPVILENVAHDIMLVSATIIFLCMLGWRRLLHGDYGSMPLKKGLGG